MPVCSFERDDIPDPGDDGHDALAHIWDTSAEEKALNGDVDALVAHEDVEVVNDFDSLFGAQGHGPATYVRDPNGNLVELKRYGAR